MLMTAKEFKQLPPGPWAVSPVEGREIAQPVVAADRSIVGRFPIASLSCPAAHVAATFNTLFCIDQGDEQSAAYWVAEVSGLAGGFPPGDRLVLRGDRAFMLGWQPQFARRRPKPYRIVQVAPEHGIGPPVARQIPNPEHDEVERDWNLVGFDLAPKVFEFMGRVVELRPQLTALADPLPPVDIGVVTRARVTEKAKGDLAGWLRETMVRGAA